MTKGRATITISVLLFAMCSPCFAAIFYFNDLLAESQSTFYNYRNLSLINFRDSILYRPKVDQLLISTNTSVHHLDSDKLLDIQTLTIADIVCYVDQYSRKYPCHLSGYWGRIIWSDVKSDNNQLFICHSNNGATYHNLRNFQETSLSLPPKCVWKSGITYFASDNHFYVGTLEGGPKIMRFPPSFPENIPLRKKNALWSVADSNWIQQYDYIQFVYVFENKGFVYFLLKEVAEENKVFCGEKTVKSRIIRISKADEGGERYRSENNWMTFTKATIICPDNSGDIKYSSFNYLENAYFDEEKEFLYATFSSGQNGPPAAVVCLYTISDINNAFDGPYVNRENLKEPASDILTRCTNSKECEIKRAKTYQLKFTPVVPGWKNNLIQQFGEIWTHIQVTTVDRSSRQYEVIFVATSNNEIKKFYRKLTDNKLCYSETLILTKSPSQPIVDMKIINSKTATQPFLIIATQTRVYKVSIEHCWTYRTYVDCTDPYCFWDVESKLCRSIFKMPLARVRQLPELTECYASEKDQNSIWQLWSPWHNCGRESNQCQCRWRSCREGLCVNVGSYINNIEYEIRNCSQHVQWSSWSSWSACSASCGNGRRTRQRWCYSGTKCPGESAETQNCSIRSNCQNGENKVHQTWSEESECSVKCGEGVITRKKDCSSNENDNKCSLIDFKPCKSSSCVETTISSPEISLGDNPKEFYTAVCQANISSSDDFRIEVEYEFQNYSIAEGLWNCWSEWSNCSCSSEKRPTIRTRSCKIDNVEAAKEICLGLTKETKDCSEQCNQINDNTGIFIDDERKFELVHIIVVGVSTFTGSILLIIGIFCIYITKHKPMERLTSTLPRPITQSFMRQSYSPVAQSPPQTPSYSLTNPDIYSSLQRPRRQMSPMYIPSPQIMNEKSTFAL